jgi:pyruvate dehydrogenase E2 component (dihydrolipoamide acetyltransferase)
LARRLAEELGIDLRTVEGTGPGGRITREDIEAAAQKQRPAPALAPVAPAAPAPAVGVERKATRMQETIARRMVQSKTTAPHYYVTVPIDLTEAGQLRVELNATWMDVRVGITEMLVKAVGMALQAYPLVNASWQDGQIVYHEAVNVGLIVATPEGGLLVPVLHGVQWFSALPPVTGSQFEIDTGGVGTELVV